MALITDIHPIREIAVLETVTDVLEMLYGTERPRRVWTAFKKYKKALGQHCPEQMEQKVLCLVFEKA